MCIFWYGIFINRVLRRMFFVIAFIYFVFLFVIGELFFLTRINLIVIVFDVILVLEDFLENVGKVLVIVYVEVKVLFFL